jgi:hypothetical protein
VTLLLQDSAPLHDAAATGRGNSGQRQRLATHAHLARSWAPQYNNSHLATLLHLTFLRYNRSNHQEGSRHKLGVVCSRRAHP